MSESQIVYRNDPYRAPDWRWHLATFLQRNKLKLSRPNGDSYVAQAKKFAIAWESAKTLNQQYTVADKYSPLFKAWSIYSSTGSPQNGRWELEARLLAGQSYEGIAQTAGISVAISEAYERTFFDVRSRLDNPGLIMHAVIKPSLAKGISEREPDSLWKLFGYWCGADMLDLLIYRFAGRQHPSSPSELLASMGDNIRQHVRLKALIAIVSMPINWQNQTEVLNLHQRMTEFAANMGGDAADNSMQAGIVALMESLPWTRNASEARAKGLTDDLEKDGVGLRADELLLRAAGQSPAGLEELVASAKYPPRDRKTTVSN